METDELNVLVIMVRGEENHTEIINRLGEEKRLLLELPKVVGASEKVLLLA